MPFVRGLARTLLFVSCDIKLLRALQHSLTHLLMAGPSPSSSCRVLHSHCAVSLAWAEGRRGLPTPSIPSSSSSLEDQSLESLLSDGRRCMCKIGQHWFKSQNFANSISPSQHHCAGKQMLRVRLRIGPRVEAGGEGG